MLWLSAGAIAFLLLPLAMLLLRPLLEGGAGEMVSIMEAGAGEAVFNSLLFALGSSVLACAVGVTCAALVVWSDLPGRGIVSALAIMPLFFPALFYGFGWVILSSPNAGMINQLAGSPVLDIFSMRGMIWVEAHHSVPLVFLLGVGAFRALPSESVIMARVTGASNAVLVRRIILPFALPALLAAFALVFARTIGSFEVPAMLGTPAGITMISTYIYLALQRGLDDLTAVAGFAGLVMLVSIVVLLLARRYRAQVDGWRSQSASGYFLLGKWRYPTAAAAIAWLALTSLAPLYALLMRSLTQRLDPESFWQPWSQAGRWSGENYAAVLSDPGVWSASASSFILALLAASTLMFVAVLLIWSSRRRGSALARRLIAISHIVFSLPGIIVGMSILVSYGLLTRSGAVLIGIAYCLRGLPYALVYADRALGQVAASLWHSARIAGASRPAALRRILLPLAAPLVVAGLCYVFVISVREVSSSVLLYSPGQEVISVFLWQFWQDGELGRFAALSVCLAAVTTALLYPAHRALARPA